MSAIKRISVKWYPLFILKLTDPGLHPSKVASSFQKNIESEDIGEWQSIELISF